MQPTMEVAEIETRQPMLAASGFSVNSYSENAIENNQQLSQKPQSLMVVKQATKPNYTISDEGGEMRISTSRVQAVVSKQTGRVRFLDAQGTDIRHYS